MELKFEINLQNLCIIALADSLWKKEKILRKTKTYFCSPTKLEKVSNWYDISKSVQKYLDPESLPEILYTEVKYVIKHLGEIMKDWFNYCRMRSIFRAVPKEELYEDYCKKIYWTHYGTVDEKKIIRSWFNNPKCDLWKVYVMACCFCSEELIREIWVEVENKYDPLEFEYLYKRYGWHLAAYWNRKFSNELENFVSDIKLNFCGSDFYDENKSIEENMLLLSIYKGYKSAVEAFWILLDKEKKMQGILSYLWQAVSFGNDKRQSAMNYRDEQFTEIIVFLLNNLPESHQMQLIKNEQVFKNILLNMGSWPWLKLFMQFVNYSKEYYGEKEYEAFSSTFYNYFSGKGIHSAVNEKKVNIFQLLRLDIWKIVPSEYKEKVSKKFVTELFRIKDIHTLQVILNDKYLRKTRNQLIAQGYSFFENWEKKFIKLLIPLKWKVDIRTNMEKIYKHLMKGKFDLADELLSSFCQSEEEANGFKSTIDTKIICDYLINKNELHLADKFLNWRFNSEEIANRYKSAYYFDKDFTVSCITNYWYTNKENVEQARQQSDNFLKWFLNSQKLVDRFKGDFHPDKFLDLFSDSNFEIMDDFMSWSLKSNFEKKKIKEKCTSEDQLFDKMGEYMEFNDIANAQKLLNWVFNSDKEKDKFLVRFLQSDFSVKGCKVFIGDRCDSKMFHRQLSEAEIAEKMKIFIKFWLKPIKKTKLNNLIKNLQEWPETSFKYFEEAERKDIGEADSSDEEEKESLWFDFENVYCEKENLNLFMSLLKLFENGDSEFSD